MKKISYCNETKQVSTNGMNADEVLEELVLARKALFDLCKNDRDFKDLQSRGHLLEF